MRILPRQQRSLRSHVGLVVKAGLAEEDSAVVLGALASAAEALAGPEAESERRLFRRMGDRLFADDQNNA